MEEHWWPELREAEKWCSRAFFLQPEQLIMLTEACRNHELGLTTKQVTIGVCWENDRLDLDRVGRNPDPDYMSTALGRKLALMRPNDRRRLVGMG